MQPDLILVPFAQDAPAVNVDAIPVNLGPSDPPQAASWSQGFPTVTMTPLAAGGIPPRGQSFNGVLQGITQHLVYIGGGGQYRWSQDYVTAKGGYSIGDVIQADSGLLSYVSLVDNNTDNFNTMPSSIGPKWRAWAGAPIPDATTSQRGAVLLATQSQVNAGSGDAVVTPEGRAVAAQNQASIAFATSGTATTQILTPVPAIPSYATGQRFNVAFNVASGASPTINVSGRGPKSLKQYDATGAKVAAVFAVGHNSDIVYDGADWVLLNQLPATVSQRKQSFRGLARNWKATASGTSVNITCSADDVVVANSSGDCVTVPVASRTLNTSVAASATVDGMAGGSTAVSTWYAVYVWYNSTSGVVRVTGDPSFTAPTPPASGFDAWAYRGSFRTDASGSKFPLAYTQQDFDYQRLISAGSNVPNMVQMTAGAAGNPTDPPVWQNIGIAPFVSPVAKKISITLGVYNNAFGIVSPNNSYGGINPAGLTGNTMVGAVGEATRFAVVEKADMILEGANIYYAASGSAVRLFCNGWSE